MANLTVLAGGHDPFGIFEGFGWSVTVKTATKLVFAIPGPNGASLTITGTSLTYSGNALTGGTVTGFSVTGFDGIELSRITDASIGAVALQNAINAFVGGSGTGQLENLFRQQIWISTGSHNDDFLVGGNGRDNLNGGWGDDSFVGFAGADTITGGPQQESNLDTDAIGWDFDSVNYSQEFGPRASRSTSPRPLNR